MNYWKYSILKVIKDLDEVSIKEISDATNMTTNDIISALESSCMLKRAPNKRTYGIYLYNRDLEKAKQHRLTVRPEDLRWTEYLSHYLPREFADEEEEELMDSDQNAQERTLTLKSEPELNLNLQESKKSSMSNNESPVHYSESGVANADLDDDSDTTSILSNFPSPLGSMNSQEHQEQSQVT